MLDESFPDHLLREKCTPIVINGLEPSTKNLSGSRQRHTTTTTTTIWLSDLMSWHICVCVCESCLFVRDENDYHFEWSALHACVSIHLFIYHLSSESYKMTRINHQSGHYSNIEMEKVMTTQLASCWSKLTCQIATQPFEWQSWKLIKLSGWQLICLVCQ